MAEASNDNLILTSKRVHKPTERGQDPLNPLNRSPSKKRVGEPKELTQPNPPSSPPNDTPSPSPLNKPGPVDKRNPIAISSRESTSELEDSEDEQLPTSGQQKRRKLDDTQHSDANTQQSDAGPSSDSVDYSQPYTFSSQWYLYEKRQEVLAEHHTGVSSDNPDFRLWPEISRFANDFISDDINEHGVDRQPCTLIRAAIIWGFKKMRQKDYSKVIKKDIEHLGTAIMAAQRQLARWARDGKVDLFIDFEGHLERPVVKKTPAKREARSAGAHARRRALDQARSSQRPSQSHPLLLGQVPRSSARTAQEEALDELNQHLQANGDWRVSVIERWRCTNGACPNSKTGAGVCWYWGIDQPKHHCPLGPDQITSWATAARNGERTLDDPGSILAAQLVFNKMKGKEFNGGSSSNTRRGNGNPVSLKVVNVMPGAGQHAGTTASFVNDESPPRSSQVSVADTKEQRERFLRWLSEKIEWNKKELDIQAMRVAFDADDLSLWQIGRLTPQNWKEYGLKGGQLERVKLAVEKYKDRFGS